MTNEYGYDNFPDTTLPVLPDAVQSDALALLLSVVEERSDIAMSVSGSHVYDRKGFLANDELGNAVSRNRSYGRTDDDVVLVLSVRIPSRVAAPLIEKTQQVLEAKLLSEKRAEAEALEASIAELTAKRDKLRGDFNV